MSWFFWRWSQHQTWMASSPPTKTSKLSHLHCRAAGPWHGRVEQNLTTDLLPQFNKSNVSSEDRNNCAKLDSTQREGPTRNEDLWLTKLLLLLTYSAASLHSAPIFCDKIKDKSPCISLVIYCLVYCSLTSHYSPYLGYWWMILEGMSSEQGEETLHFIHHLQTKSILVNIENTLDHSRLGLSCMLYLDQITTITIIGGKSLQCRTKTSDIMKEIYELVYSQSPYNCKI